ncbi:hypothetical protein HZS_5655 [Henneguya salminicola]|nr:hypothetical protein HZS_5655 [Henneguya salminicola]
MRSNIIYSDNIYYRRSRSLTDKCNARLNVKNDFSTTKGNHSCKQIISEKADIPELETSPNDFVDKFIDEKASKVDLYPNAIYQELLIVLRDKFQEYAHNIPSKDKIFSKIRKIRKTQDLSSIQGVTSAPACYKENGQPFFRRLWIGDIHNEYPTAMI